MRANKQIIYCHILNVIAHILRIMLSQRSLAEAPQAAYVYFDQITEGSLRQVFSGSHILSTPIYKNLGLVGGTPPLGGGSLGGSKNTKKGLLSDPKYPRSAFIDRGKKGGGGV
jgi:hypothetical protein